MDIYQIWTAYNNPWSMREILFFSCILLAVVIVVYRCVQRGKINKIQALPLIMNHEVKWSWALVFGVLVSAVIETSQLITMRGLFEWDDMIHNGLGCMAGAVIMNWIIGVFRKKK